MDEARSGNSFFLKAPGWRKTWGGLYQIDMLSLGPVMLLMVQVKDINAVILCTFTFEIVLLLTYGNSLTSP